MSFFQQQSGSYVPPAQAQNSPAGVGLMFERFQDQIIVKEVVQGGSAWRSGMVKAGDVLVKIGQVSIQCHSLSDLRNLIVGEPGTFVVLGFQRGAKCSPTVDNKLQKVNALMNTGLITQETFEAKAYNLPEHNVVAEAGVGIDIAECHPFMVNGLRAGGPAEKTGVIKVGDLLEKVDNVSLQPHLTGDQVRALVIGPEGSVVELHFLENPQRTHRGNYRVRLIRKAPNPGGLTRTNAADANAGASGGAVNGVLYSDDFDIDSSEQAIKHHYDARQKKWTRSLINVIVKAEPFAEGAMRTAHHMQDLSAIGAARQYVLKMSKDPADQPQQYFDDVQMQMEAKMYADFYNAKNPPKKVDFLDAYVLELKDRPHKPICAVEKYIEGEYKKYNNNWNWSDDLRNTPQAFSHFTYEHSGCRILVCDIQGVGDTWTDPQIHSFNSEGYGKGNLGQEGISTFLESHNCNEICQFLQLRPTSQLKISAPGATHIAPQRARPAAPHVDSMSGKQLLCMQQALLEKEEALREQERERREKEELARQNAALQAEKQRALREQENERQKLSRQMAELARQNVALQAEKAKVLREEEKKRQEVLLERERALREQEREREEKAELVRLQAEKEMALREEEKKRQEVLLEREKALREQEREREEKEDLARQNAALQAERFFLKEKALKEKARREKEKERQEREKRQELLLMKEKALREQEREREEKAELERQNAALQAEKHYLKEKALREEEKKRQEVLLVKEEALREQEREREEKAELARQNAALQAELLRVQSESTNILKLCEMGFDRAMAEEALKCNTNVDDAVEWCINKHDDAPNGALNGAALGRGEKRGKRPKEKKAPAPEVVEEKASATKASPPAPAPEQYPGPPQRAIPGPPQRPPPPVPFVLSSTIVGGCRDRPQPNDHPDPLLEHRLFALEELCPKKKNPDHPNLLLEQRLFAPEESYSSKNSAAGDITARSMNEEDDSKGSPTKWRLARNGDYRKLEAMLTLENVNDRDTKGDTCLHHACKSGHKRIAKMVLRLGTDINAQNKRGNTCLHYCFSNGYEELGEYLISKGADESILNEHGATCREVESKG